MLTAEEIKDYNSKLPDHLFKYVNRKSPFLFLDFEVFKNDWLVCFSTDGINIKSIVNDEDKFKSLILNKLHDRVLIAYNGNNYDKYINLAVLNDLNTKEVNDNLINNFNFNFDKEYKDSANTGRTLMWYDPSSRLGGSLKTYEACEGEDIYESEVDFNLDRKLTPAEIEETINYCSFDVKMLIKYFYRENFDSFLGHIGLVEQTINARSFMEFYKALPKTDASLVGTYLCSNKGIDTTKDTDTIKLPKNIHLGKYKDQVQTLLDIPIKTLKNGTYNGLNAWSIKTIEKSINKANDTSNLTKLQNKETKSLEKIKKHKLELQALHAKDKLTEAQIKKLSDFPIKIQEEIKNLNQIRENIQSEKELLNELNTLMEQLSAHEENDFCNSHYNYILAKIIDKANVTDNSKKQTLISYLRLSNKEIYELRYLKDKKATLYNSIMIEQPFEVRLNIKGVPHLFKTGGIHSVFGKPMFFDKRTEHDKTRRLLIADVGSLYPNLMRVFNLCSIGMDDPNAYAQMIFDRIKLKKAKDPFANVLKLILNTTYGCMGSEYNNLYDPTNRLKVCIFGQCAIVDLLDKLEDKISGLEIFQSNTDGIIISCEDYEYDDVEKIIHEWEDRTGLEMEIDESLYLAQKDVSNYILIEK